MSNLTFTTMPLRIAGLGPVGDLPLLDSSLPAPDATASLASPPRSVLPYSPRSSYDRAPATRELPVAILENEHLRAVFLTSLGGRLWSLVDTATGAELLHTPQVIQPANLALRDAWFAGGVEWNLGVRGHWGLTCDPVLSGRIETDAGHPVLRMWEYERLLGLVWRVDAWLPADSRVLFVRPVIANHTDSVVDVYWWSNAAVPQNPDTRVVVPATSAVNFGPGGEPRRVGVPEGRGEPVDHPAAIHTAEDFFFDIEASERHPWIAIVDSAGRGVFQASTERLRGRKLFVWGASAGGRRWQRWLSGDDGEYLEIQGGLAPTQFDDEPLAPGETWTWTEAYGPLHAELAREPDAGRSEDAGWSADISAVATAIDRVADGALLDREHERASGWALLAPTDVRGAGSGAGTGAGGWGALEVAAGHLTDVDGTPFDDEWVGPDQRPWLELVSAGALPAGDVPAAAIAGPNWRNRLDGRCETWHDWLQLGYLRLAAGSVDTASEAFERSQQARDNPWALRALAAVARSRGQFGPAADLALRARRGLPESAQLLTETLAHLAADGRNDAILDLLDTVSGELRSRPRVLVAEALAAVRAGRVGRASAIIESGLELPDIREGDEGLGVLWAEWTAATGRDDPLPADWDFRMFAEATP